MIEPREVIQELEEMRTTYEDDTALHEWLGIAVDTIRELMVDLCSCYQLVSIQQIRTDIKNIKMTNMKKTTHKPKTKHKSEAQKVADQRKKQIAEAQKNAKEGLQDSLELNSRLEAEPEPDLESMDV